MTTQATGPARTQGGLTAIEAGIAAYLVLVLLADTEVAPVAVALAWGTTALYVLKVVRPGLLTQFMKGTLGSLPFAGG